MSSRPSLRTVELLPSHRSIAGDVIGRTDDVVVVAAARAETTLLALAQALGRRAARVDFAAAQEGLRAKADDDGLD